MLDSETSHKIYDGPIGTSFDAAKVFNRRIALRCEISVYFYFLFKLDKNWFVDAKCIVFVNIFTILASPDIRQRPSGLLTVIVWALME